MLNVGKRIGNLAPFCDSEWGQTAAPRPAECVWAHPEGHFCVLEFDCPGGKVRESFSPFDLGEIPAEEESEAPPESRYVFRRARWSA